MTDKLRNIKANMDVYDSEADKIGTVEFVQMGSGGATPGDRDQTELDPEVNTAYAAPKGGAVLLPEDEPLRSLPEVARERLLMHGFVKVDRAPLQSSALVMTEQIESVASDRVTLNVPKDDLITV